MEVSPIKLAREFQRADSERESSTNINFSEPLVGPSEFGAEHRALHILLNRIAYKRLLTEGRAVCKDYQTPQVSIHISSGKYRKQETTLFLGTVPDFFRRKVF